MKIAILSLIVLAMASINEYGRMNAQLHRADKHESLFMQIRSSRDSSNASSLSSRLPRGGLHHALSGSNINFTTGARQQALRLQEGRQKRSIELAGRSWLQELTNRTPKTSNSIRESERDQDRFESWSRSMATEFALSKTGGCIVDLCIRFDVGLDEPSIKLDQISGNTELQAGGWCCPLESDIYQLALCVFGQLLNFKDLARPEVSTVGCSHRRYQLKLKLPKELVEVIRSLHDEDQNHEPRLQQRIISDDSVGAQDSVILEGTSTTTMESPLLLPPPHDDGRPDQRPTREPRPGSDSYLAAADGQKSMWQLLVQRRRATIWGEESTEPESTTVSRGPGRVGSGIPGNETATGPDLRSESNTTNGLLIETENDIGKSHAAKIVRLVVGQNSGVRPSKYPRSPSGVSIIALSVANLAGAGLLIALLWTLLYG